MAGWLTAEFGLMNGTMVALKVRAFANGRMVYCFGLGRTISAGQVMDTTSDLMHLAWKEKDFYNWVRHLFSIHRTGIGVAWHNPTSNNILRTMDAEQHVRQLRLLKRTVEQLEAEFAHGRIDEGLLADIDRMLEDGVADGAEAANLKGLLERLRENTLTPRAELYGDGIRDCRRVKATIEGVIAVLG